jgi:alkylmercury lyase
MPSTPGGASPSGRALRDAGFRAVLAGRAVPLADLASAVGAPETDGEELVACGLLVIDDARCVVGAHGLSLVPTRQHRLTVRGRTFWTWCAIDAVGIAAALREDALFETTCHVCQRPVRVRFARGMLAGSSHPEARLWNARHLPGRSMAGGTCGLMNLFCTPEHLMAWQFTNPDEPGDAIDLAGAIELGHEWWGTLR